MLSVIYFRLGSCNQVQIFHFVCNKKLKSIIAMLWLVFPLVCKYHGFSSRHIVTVIDENVCIKIAA